MGNYYGGCDIGSTTGKAVIFDDDGMVASALIPSGSIRWRHRNGCLPRPAPGSRTGRDQ